MSGVCQGSSFPRAFHKNETREVSVLSGDGLRLSDEPLKCFLAALLLQFLPDHVPAGLVIVVEPVTLQEGERRTCSVLTIKPLPKAT